MNNKIKVIVAHVDGRVEKRQIDNTLEAFQDLVGGCIQTAPIAQINDENMIVLCNEEGLLRQMEPNKALFPFFFVGNVVFVNYAEDEFASLTPAQSGFVEGWLKGLNASVH